MPPASDSGGDLRKMVAATGRAAEQSSLGLTLAFSVFIGFGIGLGLDRVLHTTPVLMLAFLVLGIVAGFIAVFRAARYECS
jgi:ATP synthase protein I